MRWLAALVPLLLVACDYVEETRETGHKGRARVNPYLAAERLLERLDHGVTRQSGWPDLDSGELSTVLLPASVLGADGYVVDLERWALRGGHAVVLLENGESYLNDWSQGGGWSFSDEEHPEALESWLERVGIELSHGGVVSDSKKSADQVVVEGREFEVWMEARSSVGAGGESGLIASVPYGRGRLTVVADARPFRNRYIGDYDHAELLAWLVDLSPSPGYRAVSFIRNASLSFWALLWQRAWAFLVALLLLVGFWLWKNLPRFGPLDSREVEGELRAYDHHLEALGDFHWRLDRGEGLLRPLRESLIERTHRLAIASGQQEVDVFELMAQRAGLTRERAERAMTFERARDAGSFTRLVADLQKLHLSIP